MVYTPNSRSVYHDADLLCRHVVRYLSEGTSYGVERKVNDMADFRERRPWGIYAPNPRYILV